MKKVLLGAAISAALFGGAAQATIALDPTTNLPTADTLNNSTVIYASGSSAQSNLVETALKGTGTSADVCLAGSVYKFVDNGGNSDQTAYLCLLNTVANGSSTPNTNIPTSITTPNLLLYKRNAGGSIYGIAPIAGSNGSANPQPIDFLNIVNNTTAIDASGAPCSQNPGSKGFVNVLTCTYTKGGVNSTTATPTFGVADVNPSIFNTASQNALINAPGLQVDGTFPAPSSNGYLAVPGPAVVFGVGVTLKMRNALQAVYFGAASVCNPANANYAASAELDACMPSMSRNQVAAIFSAYTAPVAPLVANINAPAAGSGKIVSWKQLGISTSNLYDKTTGTNKPGSDRVHICSRTVGSGTKAQFGAVFLRNACDANAATVVNNADHAGINEANQYGFTYTPGPFATPETTFPLRPMVHAMSAAGDLEECMNDLDLGLADTVGNFTPGSAYGATGPAAVRWAMAFQSLDKNASRAKNYRFIKIDGVAPTLANVANGTYPDWVEGTFTYNIAQLATQDAANPGTKALTLQLISSFTNPSVLSVVDAANGAHGFGLSGFLASPNPTNAWAKIDGTVNVAAPVNPLSYSWFYPANASASVVANNATDDCRVPTIYSNNKAYGSNGTTVYPNNNNQILKLR